MLHTYIPIFYIDNWWGADGGKLLVALRGNRALHRHLLSMDYSVVTKDVGTCQLTQFEATLQKRYSLQRYCLPSHLCSLHRQMQVVSWWVNELCVNESQEVLSCNGTAGSQSWQTQAPAAVQQKHQPQGPAVGPQYALFLCGDPHLRK